MRLIWTNPAIDDLAQAAGWSQAQAGAVVDSMERMTRLGFSLGRPTGRPGIRYWPVPPLGVFYRIEGQAIVVLQIVDARRMLELP